MKRGIAFLSALLLGAIGINVSSREPLSFEERVKAQEAIERVYYNHRIWPKENPQPKPAFEKMVTKEQIEAKVTDYLKKCSALDQFWQRPVIASQLQAEMDRMAKGSKDPATLNELFAALNNDPYIIAECLARPVLADRLIHNWYEYDERFHKETKDKAEEALKHLTPGNFCGYSEGQYSKMKYRLEVDGRNEMEKPYPEEKAIRLDDKEFAIIAAELPGEGKISGVIEKNDCFVIIHTLEKNEGEIEVENLSFRKTSFDEWMKHLYCDLSGVVYQTENSADNCYSPAVLEYSCTEGWLGMTLTGVPDGRIDHTAIWTGSEMIVWGGEYYSGGWVYLNSGGRYSPATDSWQTVSSGTDCPTARDHHTAVWTGAEMIIWGGYDGSACLNTGGKYNPVSNSWTATSTGTDCPTARDYHTAVWTGAEMIIWGGGDYGGYLNTGGQYNPTTENWTPTSTGTNCPIARSWHFAFWTGTVMIVWGGYCSSGLTNSGGLYNPIEGTWAATLAGIAAPVMYEGISAVWTGSVMIVWGGIYFDTENGIWIGSKYGSRYNPSTNSWLATSQGTSSLKGRGYHSAIWSGNEMIIWGGWAGSGFFNSGGRYNPVSNSWTATSTGTNCPSAREMHTAVWTGNEMVVWGGKDYLDLQSGGIYYIPYSPSGFSNSSSSDLGGCADSGVFVEWSTPSNWGDGSSGTRTFDIQRDGTPLVTGLSESTLSYIDTTGDNGVSYLYQVRANNGCGLSTTTTGMSAADNIGTAPDEVSNFDDVYSWDAVIGADGYRLYRGTLADLPNLMNSTDDGCLRYQGTATSFDCSSDDPGLLTDRLYWYIVTAYTGACEGTAGEGTGFTRVLSSSETCP